MFIDPLYVEKLTRFGGSTGNDIVCQQQLGQERKSAVFGFISKQLTNKTRRLFWEERVSWNLASANVDVSLNSSTVIFASTGG